MAEKLMLDDGILELDINGNGLLRFNPSDPNVYQRFISLYKELPELESKYASEVEGDVAEEGGMEAAGAVLDRMKEMDTEVKNRLSLVFGADNDFDTLLGGVNLMAVGRNGQRIVTNLLAALTPYVEEGVKKHQTAAAAGAVAQARENRAHRRGK